MPELEQYDYPGLGLHLRWHDQVARRQDLYPIGVHINCFGSGSEMLLIREVAMMIVMDRLSDKPDFHVKVFDDAIAEKWIEEALALPVDPMYDDIVKGRVYRKPEEGDGEEDEDEEEDWRHRDLKRLKTILDRESVEYCIQELRAKAKFFKKTGLVPTLDATASVVKSDVLVDASLHDELRAAFAKLKEDQKDDPDWHPRTNEKVLDLVHPSLFPLVYGRTRVLRREVVGIKDAIDKWIGKGDVIPQTEEKTKKTPRARFGYGFDGDHNVSIGGGKIHPSYWSTKYQWLPSNVEFQDDGSVRFTSYINNLHPVKHRDVYGTIEKLIEKALPAWDFCLALYENFTLVGGGRTEPRFPRPDNPDDENESNWDPREEDVQVPPPREEGDDQSGDDDEGDYYGSPQHVQWLKIREPLQPDCPDFVPWGYGVKPGQTLRERFKDTGLQVIVKVASIELTPEKPDFPPGGWHVEGQMNEHIVGTALYYLDSENVTPSHLHFRMQTDSYQDDWNVGQDAYHWMEQVYGTKLGSGGPCLQSYGSVETKQGRLLAFPNVFHHRVSPFELKDKTKPGHRRFIALWLVDPLTRIINTGNVPPQQQSWWMERTFGKLSRENAKNVPQSIAQLVLDKAPGIPGLEAASAQGGVELPPELMDMIKDEFGDAVPMGVDEAREQRLELMDERTAFQDEARDKWERVEYSFCEH